MISWRMEGIVVVVISTDRKINDNDLLELALGCSVDDIKIKTVLNNYEGATKIEEILKNYGENN